VEGVKRNQHIVVKADQRVGLSLGVWGSLERGLACLEAAVWCMVLLPVVFLGFALYGYTYDMNVVQMIPESIMREASGRLITWSPNQTGAGFVVDIDRLNRTINQLADRAIEEVGRQTDRIAQGSARACYWVVNVSPSNGRISPMPIASNCTNRGTFAGNLNLERLRIRRMRQGIAKPVLTTTGAVQGFVPRAVLLGVAVGGQFTGLAETFRLQNVQHGTVWVPREDVYL
jgi:hypothetical protein